MVLSPPLPFSLSPSLTRSLSPSLHVPSLPLSLSPTLHLYLSLSPLSLPLSLPPLSPFPSLPLSHTLCICLSDFFFLILFSHGHIYTPTFFLNHASLNTSSLMSAFCISLSCPTPFPFARVARIKYFLVL